MDSPRDRISYDAFRADPSVDWFTKALDVPASRSVVVPEAKHLVSEEVPERIAELILSLVHD